MVSTSLAVLRPASLRKAAAGTLTMIALALIIPQQALAQSAACSALNADYSSGAPITLAPPSGSNDSRYTEYGPPFAGAPFAVGETISWSAQSSGPGDTTGSGDWTVALTLATNSRFPADLYNDGGNFNDSGSFQITAADDGYLSVYALVENVHPISGLPQDPPSSLTFSVSCAAALSPPTLTSLTPTTGTIAGGTSVVLTGTGLTGATAVTFGGAAASSFTVDSTTQITAVTPAHAAGAVDVVVTTPGGSATAAGAYTFEAPTLSVGDVSLAEGNAGTTSFTFTVSLSSPAGPGGVTFDIATADNTASAGDGDYTGRSLTGQTVPAGASTYDFTVLVNGDTAFEPNETFFVNVTNVTGATVADGQGTGTILNDDVAAPTLTSLAPVSGPTSGGTTVTIVGTDLTGATAVTFGGVPATSFTMDSATQITAVTPAHAAGTVDVVVITPGGSATAAGAFAYEEPASTDANLASLAISSGTLDPAFAPGTTSYAVDVPNAVSAITLTPTAADDGASITVNGTPVASGAASAPIALSVGSNPITIVVTAEDGVTTRTYNIVAARAIAVPTITSIAPDTGSTAGGTSVVITGTNLTGASAVTFGGTAATSFTIDSATQITAVTPAHVAGTVDVVVTTPGGTATAAGSFTYEEPASTDANLAGLTVSTGTLDPAFAPGTTSYAVDVPNAVSSLTFTPTAADDGASITVNGAPVTSGAASAPIALSVGSNTVTVVVTAEDGVATRLYTIDVARGAMPAPQITGVDVPVSGTYKAGDILSFTVDFDQPVTANIAGTPALSLDIGGSARGASYMSGSGTAALAFRYVVQPGDLDANGIAISALELNGGTITNVDGTGADLTLHNVASTASVNVDAVAPTVLSSDVSGSPASDATTAEFVVTFSEPVTAVDSADFSLATTGSAAGTISGVSTANSISYTVAVNGISGTGMLRLDVVDNGSVQDVVGNPLASAFTSGTPWARGGSANSQLSALVPSAGTLDPAFAAGTLNYVLQVAHSVDAVTLTPTAADTNATITVDGQVVGSGSASQSFTLAVGMTLAVTIEVTAQNGSSTVYTVAFSRAASADADLSNLVPSAGVLAPTFDPATTNYSIAVANPIDTITITPTAADSNASIAVDGQTVASGNASQAIALGVGSTAIPVVVTAQDGATIRSYTVTVIRAVAAPTVTSISPANGSTGGGEPVVIAGTGFTGTTTITFGGVAAASVTVDSLTQITAVTPAHAAGVVDVAVTTPGGSATAAHAFAYEEPTPAPTLTSVAPDVGATAGGTSVTITGTALTDATVVIFGGIAATSFTIDSATQITAVTPAHTAGAVDVAVTTPGGSATAAGAFTYEEPIPAPKLSNVSPDTGSTAGGTSVVITGTDLTGASAVTFGGTAASSFTVDSATQITAVTPAHAAGAVDVVVTTPGGSATAAGAFAYEEPASTDANLASLAISSGTLSPAFAPGTTSYAVDLPNAVSSITLTPTAADDGASITVNGTPLASGAASAPIALSVGSNPITIVVTAEDGVTARTYNIVAARAIAVPTITGIAPDTGSTAGGTSVVITGTNLAGASAVTFGGTAAASFTIDSATQITAVTPAHIAGAVDVLVTTPGDTATAAGSFTYEEPIPTPTLTGVAPATGTTAGGTSVVITGTHLLDASAVTFGGIAATSFTVDSATQITATAPAHGAGAVDLVVTTPGGSATASAAFTYEVPIPAPIVTEITPDTGTTAGGTSVTVTGTNLNGASAVTFGGIAATSYTVDSGTQITATTPAHAAGAVDVVVTTPGGSASATAAFTYEEPTRPDPTLDPEVVGLLKAQADMATRVAQNQTRNFHRRLEQLHQEGDRRSSNMSVRIGYLQDHCGSASEQQLAKLLALSDVGPDEIGSTNPMSDANACRSRGEPMLAARDGAPVDRPSRLGGLTSGPVAVWSGGFVNFGQSDGGELDLDYTMIGVSGGVDARFSDRLVGGIGFGYGRDRSDVGSNGTRNRANAYSGALYGSYQPVEQLFIDGLIGGSLLEFDSRRFVTANGEFATGNRSGTQLFGSLTAAYDVRDEKWLLAPYGRVEFSRSWLKGFTEAGGDIYGLTYGEQTVDILSGVAGLRANYALEMKWGILRPGLRTEYTHDFRSTSRTSLGYTDLGGLPYSLEFDPNSRDHATLGLSLEMMFRNDINLGLDYRTSFGGSGNQGHLVGVQVDGRF